ncbi:ABC transporter ATP-binding protein [Corynebacterium glyciniphilum]|uniref:ABC transporter ATP-binding protein n=1 Tax=Corynebacterium glyciniphilum TaxID=1404244 RepID=UPI0021B3A787|nr:ABC transporter ATP-binding protein [Corynebacterium glyciniphilum]
MSPADPASGTSPEKEAQNAGTAALKGLLAPVSGALTIGRILAALSAVLSVIPYVALVRIGEILLRASATGSGVDGLAVRHWLFILVGTFSARLLIYFAALTVTHVADVRLGHIIRGDLVARLAKVPLSWFTATNSGRVRKALQDDITTVHQLIAHQPVEGTNAVVMPLALMVYAFVIDWRLGLLSIATVPLYLVSNLVMLRGMGEKTVEMDRRLGDVSARMVEFVTGITVVKAFGQVGRAHSRYQRAADAFYTFYFEWCRPMIRMAALGQSTLAVPLILLVNLGGGAWLVRHGHVSVADVTATSLIALLVPFAIEVGMNSLWSRQLAGQAALRLSTLLGTPALRDAREEHETHGNTPIPGNHNVVFDHVTFAYDGSDTPAVDDVTFNLSEDTVTALVGPSGSGKSTIATLLARFADADSGSVTIGGVPVSDIPELYSHVGFVLQDPQLLGISIRDNIALGRPGATDTQIRDAARAAHILTEIEALPHGLETILGTGSGLSGGQAQRIAIARALLVDAPVLVLDEATALTDPESQHEIQQALSTLVQGRTVLLIAHRPEVIAGVDQVVLIDDGRVIATGDHDSMLSHPGYARLWNAAQTDHPEGPQQ